MPTSKNAPVDARVRLAIAQWPDDAPRGAVTTFCVEHGISRKTFYAVRARARAEGQAAALEPRSRRPKSSPTRISEQIKAQALGVRAALESSGLDHGPVSVHDKMLALGMNPVPSVASLARIFRDKGVARLEPKKKPRSAWRRFVYPAPNACWQIDATEYVLTGGRSCVIFQLIDDHSRYALASHVAWTETAKAAVAVAKKAIATHGVPQRLLSDNGTALNPSRRGWSGQLTEYLAKLGVETITGRPYKPTTQGKNERFHQTLFRWLDKQPLAQTLEELQAQVEAFDHAYNTTRPHQGLPGRITPAQAWEATPKADPPRPRPPATDAVVPGEESAPPAPRPTWRDTPGEHLLKVRSDSTVMVHRVIYKINAYHRGRRIYVNHDTSKISFYDTTTGELLLEHPIPAPGVKYVGDGTPPGRPRNPKPSPMS
jgi:transposase InsO family protein